MIAPFRVESLNNKLSDMKYNTVKSRFLQPSVSRTSRYLEPNLVSTDFAALMLYNFIPDFSNSRFLETPDNSNQEPEGISLHNSPPSGSVLSSWKRFVSSNRKNFNPTGRFVVCSEHITDDCFSRFYHVGASMKRLVQGAIPSAWKKKLKTIYFLVIIAP